MKDPCNVSACQLCAFYDRVSLPGLQNHMQHEMERMKNDSTKPDATRRIKVIGKAIKAKKDALSTSL